MVQAGVSSAGVEFSGRVSSAEDSRIHLRETERKVGTEKIGMVQRLNCMDRNVNVVVGLSGEKIVLINDIRFRGKKREDWKEVKNYLKEYVGEFYEIEETSEKVFISSSFPDEYTASESRLSLKGAVAKAKANAAQGIPKLIQIATNREHSANTKKT